MSFVSAAAALLCCCALVCVCVSPSLVTFSCCSNAGLRASEPEGFGYIPGLGWLQEPLATYFSLALAILIAIGTGVGFACLSCCKRWRIPVSGAVLAAFVAVLAAQPHIPMMVEETVAYAAGEPIRRLYNEYVYPGFGSEDIVLTMVETAEYYDEQTAAKTLMPSSIPILNQSQIERTLKGINELQHIWKHISSPAGPLPMFTLGHASYLHGNVPHLNDKLHAEFQWLYDIVEAALSKHLGTCAKYMSGSNVPGFHLFLSSVVWGLPVYRVHSDLQYAAQVSGVATGDINVLSFTLPIQLPRFSRAGLWTYTSKTSDMVAEGDVTRFESGFVREFHEYKVGEMTIHGGVLNHQIAPSVTILPGEARITLQGHGYFDEQQNCWMLYW